MVFKCVTYDYIYDCTMGNIVQVNRKHDEPLIDKVVKKRHARFHTFSSKGRNLKNPTDPLTYNDPHNSFFLHYLIYFVDSQADMDHLSMSKQPTQRVGRK